MNEHLTDVMAGWPSAEERFEGGSGSSDHDGNTHFSLVGKRKRESDTMPGDTPRGTGEARPRSSRIGLLESKKNKKMDEEERKEEDTRARAEEKRVAREVRRAEKAAADKQAADARRCALSGALCSVLCSLPNSVQTTPHIPL